MLLPDVNILIYAHRPESPRHAEYAKWLAEHLDGPEPLGLSEFVLTSFVRIVTQPRAFDPPATSAEALGFCEALLASIHAVPIRPGRRHWGIFAVLVIAADARGGLITDAYLAALAIESGSELISADRDFARFPGLRWRHPLALR